MPEIDLDPHEWRLKGAKPVPRKPEDPLGPNTYRIVPRDQIPAEHIAFPFQAGVPGAGIYMAGVSGGVHWSASAFQSWGWADPLIGFRWEVPVLDRLSLAFRGDIGGFGASSDLIWGIDSEVRYWLPSIVTVPISYPLQPEWRGAISCACANCC